MSNKPGVSQDLKAKMVGIEALVQQTVELFKKLSPVDANQPLLEELERMKKQNAELRALQSQSQESNSVNPPVPSSKRIPDMFRATSTCEEIRRVVSTPVDLSGALG